MIMTGLRYHSSAKQQVLEGPRRKLLLFSDFLLLDNRGKAALTCAQHNFLRMRKLRQVMKIDLQARQVGMNLVKL